MVSHSVLLLLEKHPQLRPMIKENRFLTGYTNGSGDGKLVPVFLLRSPWAQFCLQATACESLTPGGVLVVTDDPQWSLESNWKAYSLVNNSPTGKYQRNLKAKHPSMNAGVKKPVSPMTALAAEIATEEAKIIKTRKMDLISMVH